MRGTYDWPSTCWSAALDSTAAICASATGCAATGGGGAAGGGGGACSSGLAAICTSLVRAPNHCARLAFAIRSACSACTTWIPASASSACARESSAPGRSWFLTSAPTASANTCCRSKFARAARTVSCAAANRRNASAVLTATSSRVTSTPAFARTARARARSTDAPRTPKSNASHERRTAAPLPQMLDHELSSETGPEIAGMVVPGNSNPATLLRVARLICSHESTRGRYVVLARATPDSCAATRAVAARMLG